VVPKQRNKVIKHLRFAWRGRKSDREIKRIARGVFKNLAMTGVDFIFLPRLKGDKIHQWVDFNDEYMRANRILDEGNGMIIVTGHIGNWELLAAAFTLRGYGGAVVGKRLYYEKYNKMLVNLRESVGVRTIYRDSSPREMLKVLKQNQILGILPDQDVDSVEGVFINFFNQPAYTPSGPVILAAASRAAIIPCFMARQGYRQSMPIAPT